MNEFFVYLLIIPFLISLSSVLLFLLFYIVVKIFENIFNLI